MNEYERKITKEFDKDYGSICKNFNLTKRLEKKINEILENPTHYKSLRNVLKGKQRVHIGSYVLVFEVDQANREIIFHNFKHHDKVYKAP